MIRDHLKATGRGEGVAKEKIYIYTWETNLKFPKKPFVTSTLS